jgi:hypothetical protein
MVIRDKDELIDLVVNQEAKIYPQGRRFRIHHPLTGRRDVIDVSLNDIAEALYRKQLKEGRARNSGNDEVNKRDMDLFFKLMSGKIDPKAPILTLMIHDVAWFENVKRAMGVYSMAEFWPEDSREIDLTNPGVTIQNMLKKIKTVKELASKAGEYEA